jgi:hypothetical protein
MTYSLSITGFDADSLFNAKPLTLADTQAPSGAQQNAMQNGLSFLCKLPDGSSAYYKLDPYRSTPGNPVLLACGP